MSGWFRFRERPDAGQDRREPARCTRHRARGEGHEVSTARQQKLNGRPDFDLAAACRSEGQAIVTLDLDFADITAYPPEEYAGILVLRLRSQSKSHVLSVFQAVMTLFGTEPLERHLWILEESRVRIWHKW